MEDEEEHERRDESEQRRCTRRRDIHEPIALQDRDRDRIRNSFHVQMKKKMSSTDSIGREIGYTTRQRICQRLAPSSEAASSSSLGNVP